MLCTLGTVFYNHRVTRGSPNSSDSEKSRSHFAASRSWVKRCRSNDIYLADMNDYSKVNEAYGGYFDHAIAPARVCVEVSRLWEDVKIEIDCIAVLPET